MGAKLDFIKHILFEYEIDTSLDQLDEAINRNIRKVGRFKVAKIRIRSGKVYRNKRISASRNFEFSHGKLKKVNSKERRNRTRATNKARFKIRTKLPQILRKRKAALRRRKALGG